jgi:hypothetical protein
MPCNPQDMAEKSVTAIFNRASDSERNFKNILENDCVMKTLKQELRVDFSRALNKMLFDHYVFFEKLNF